MTPNGPLMGLVMVDWLFVLPYRRYLPNQSAQGVGRSSVYPCLFRRFLGDVRREFMALLFLSVVLHGSLGSYIFEKLRRRAVLILLLEPACPALTPVLCGFFLLPISFLFFLIVSHLFLGGIPLPEILTPLYLLFILKK
jgi:hypothetical protein